MNKLIVRVNISAYVVQLENESHSGLCNIYWDTRYT